MINKQLLAPDTIAVIGASNNIHKPGGKVLQNLMGGTFKGEVFPVNPREEEIQGVRSWKSISELPETDLAILAIPAKMCPGAVEELARDKQTRAFIIISAGFSEENEEGAVIEKELVSICNRYEAALIGPNCIGVLNAHYQGVFTSPIPKIDPRGCDFISGSGATAVFIMESGLPKGLTFNSVYSVGNSAQTGVEDVLQYLDESFNETSSSRIKILYIETIKDPDRLLRHASSLIRKGCKIAAIKSGTSAAGSRAASSHTGALASSDLAVEALFRKAGIVRCHGREELTTVASVLMHPELNGRRVAIITHAGGPAVMLTDALAEGGLEIPKLEGEAADELLSKLSPGASVANPIDMLATASAEQLGIVIDYCDKRFNEVDAIMVIFGTPGLTTVFDTYEVLHQKMQTCSKPVFAILPSIVTAREEVEFFLSKGHINFPDEVNLGKAITKVFNTPRPAQEKIFLSGVDISGMRRIVENAENGYLSPKEVQALLDCAGIPRVREEVVHDRETLLKVAGEVGFPMVVKVVGPLHKSDVGGVVLNVKSEEHLLAEFERMRKIKGYEGLMLQPMLSGIELFIGATYEPGFGHVVLCGLGGIFIEVIRDVSSGLAPLTLEEALSMIRSLRSYRIIQGTRGMEGVNEQMFAEIIVRLSSMLRFATEIKEMDLNPLIGKGNSLSVVDARIRVEKL